MSKTFALHTDLYELTMLASYFHRGMHEVPAVCEMFVRKLPPNRRFLVVAGLEKVLHYLEGLRFTDAQIEALKEVGPLRPALSRKLVEYLRRFRFTGDVFAMPEGTIAFENEPLLRVEAPLGEAQLVETFLLSAINHQTMIASKAARCVLAAKGRPLLEFGSRRTHPEAAVDVARAAYIAGFEGTSNVEAFYRYGVPARGTMAHMYVMSSTSEEEAFQAWGALYPSSTYLVDTYDTIEGVKHALEVAGERVSAVRLDSGDLVDLSKKTRALLRARGRDDVKIFVSSDLDEWELERLVREGEVDAAGVGTRVATSDDACHLGGVYKLVQIGDRPVAKLSPGKVTYPGAHQVFRHVQDGRMSFDHLGLAGEKRFEGIGAEPLLVKVMERGRVVHRESVHEMRKRAQDGIDKLPDKLKEIGPRHDGRGESFYEVRPSEQLLEALERCRAEMEQRP